ncbi:helix-turn-helix domain-containing protein [Hoeflea sp.]|uniref:AraC family transcriptional regulator n=1 Tax=Hoeflea sp. TaxID=1940281 RepID=UPI003B0117C1
MQQQDPDAVHVCRHGDETIRRCYSNSEIFIFFLPTIRLGLLPDQAFPGRTFPTTTAVGSILRSVLLSLPETLGESTLEDIGTLADSICALLKPALCETADTNPIDMSCFRYTEIRSYIEDNIRDSSMDADRICTVFGISRPTLYRLFKDAGGVMAYVAGRRTHHVFTELSRSSPRWGIVKSIAEKYGFQDMTQFTRTFRRHIGTTPISVVGLSVPDMPASRNASSSGGSGQFPKPLILSKPMQQYD